MPGLPSFFLEVENGPILFGEPLPTAIELGTHKDVGERRVSDAMTLVYSGHGSHESGSIKMSISVRYWAFLGRYSRAGLFVTCLVDTQRPNVGFAALRLLEQAGCEVVVPKTQTCCGQPAWNSGDTVTSKTLAKQTIEAFADLDYVVLPSGSCAGTLVKHYPEMFADDPSWLTKAHDLASRTHELMSFLHDVLAVDLKPVSFTGRVTYHDSCSGLRELGIRTQPRELLKSVASVEVDEMQDTETCCGFGGTFCVKYPDISERMVDDKLSLASQSGADVLLGGDLGCLMNIAGRASRLGLPLRVYHAAEVLADMASGPGIGADPKSGEGA